VEQLGAVSRTERVEALRESALQLVGFMAAGYAVEPSSSRPMPVAALDMPGAPCSCAPVRRVATRMVPMTATPILMACSQKPASNESPAGIVVARSCRLAL
jgi:hypothetical protein